MQQKTSATGHATPTGELARLTAARLTEAGITVTGPNPGDTHPYRLKIWCAHSPYSLTVTDDAHAELKGEYDDPHRAADIAAALLSPAPSDARHPETVSDEAITFKGIAGMDLKAKGFNVTLDIYADNEYFDVSADIAVTNPSGEPGTVHITDDGGLTWFRDLWPEHAEAAFDPEFRTWLPDPPAVARTIAGTVIRALNPGLSHDLPAAC